MIEKIKIILQAHNSENGLYIPDCTDDENVLKPIYRDLKTEGYLEYWDRHLIPTKKGIELVEFITRPMRRTINDLNDMNSYRLKLINDYESDPTNHKWMEAEDCDQQKTQQRLLEHILGPIIYHNRHDYSELSPR